MFRAAAPLRPRLAVRAALVLVVTAGLAGCTDDLEPMKHEWRVFTAELDATVAQAREQKAKLTRQLELMPELSDVEREARTRADGLRALLAEQAKELEVVDRALADAKSEVDAALTSGQLSTLTQAVTRASRAVAPAVSKLHTLSATVAARYDEVEAVVSAAAAREKARVEVMLAKKAVREAAAKATGPFAVAGLDFAPMSAALPSERTELKDALAEVEALLGECAELKIGLTGHATKDEDYRWQNKLSYDRALAVSGWLLRKGVAAERILRIRGAGANEPLAEPAASPAPAGAPAVAPAVDTRALPEPERRRHRRVTVDVIVPCGR
jgi:outer membrane protein OmpA-like peptidoglycan-associated protein